MSTTKDARMAIRQVRNPPNPWHHSHVELLGPAPEAEVAIFEDQTRQALSKNQSPDIHFDYSVNPYRGCFHACAYCYARPTHEYLDFGAGTDFERKLVIKRAIATRLQAAFDRPSWVGKLVVFSGNTDCYQPIEATYGLTRACLEVCADYKNPVGIITKSTLIERDISLLQRLHADAHLDVVVSIPFDDADVARGIEPGCPTPQRRYKTIARLAAAGLVVGVNVAPIIPGLNDETVATVLTRAREAGAVFFGQTLVRLPGPVREVFEERVRTLFPNRADKVMSALRQVRGGAVTEVAFGARMSGVGPRWAVIERLVEQTARRLGYRPRPEVQTPSPFERPPRAGDQLSLFGSVQK